jgi:hypothetical protein
MTETNVADENADQATIADAALDRSRRRPNVAATRRVSST